MQRRWAGTAGGTGAGGKPAHMDNNTTHQLQLLPNSMLGQQRWADVGIAAAPMSATVSHGRNMNTERLHIIQSITGNGYEKCWANNGINVLR